MKSNRIIFLTGFVLILLAMALGIGFTSYITLEKPVFLRYCIEIGAASGNEDENNQSLFLMQYITNRYDTRKVIGINFPDAPQLTFNASETQPYSNTFDVFNYTAGQIEGVVLGRYSLRTVYVTQYNIEKKEWNGQKELKSATFQFSDGSQMTADIGKIILYSDDYKDNSFSFLSGSSSNNNISRTTYRIEKDISLLNTDTPFKKELSDIFTLSIDERMPDKISDIQYKKGSSLNILSVTKDTALRDGKYDVYDIRPKIYYKKSDKTIGYIRLSDFRWQREFYKFQDALDYLKERGVI